MAKLYKYIQQNIKIRKVLALLVKVKDNEYLAYN